MRTHPTHPVYRLSDRELVELCGSIYPEGPMRDQHLARMTNYEINRIRVSTTLIPLPTGKGATIVDLGPATYWFPIYRWLGYQRIVGITKLDSDPNLDSDTINRWDTNVEIEVHTCDAESGRYPLQDESVQALCAFEVLEHLASDPMAAMAEANRILTVGGTLALSTPNIASWRSVLNAMRGRNPNMWSPYATDPLLSSVRHHREYSADEITLLTKAAGFEIESTQTPMLDDAERSPRTRLREFYTKALILLAGGDVTSRGIRTFVSATKVAEMIDRYPSWLYSDFLTTSENH